jgi:DnaJ-class molecular chaperone
VIIILLTLAFVLVVLAVLVISPTHTCSRCHGKRVVKRLLSKRYKACPRCKATGRSYRLGATQVHRFIRNVKDEHNDWGQ